MSRSRWLVAPLALLTGCNITDAPPPDPDRFINLTVLTGAEQVGLPGSQLSEPITVRLRSTVNGEPVRGRGVTFRPPSNSGITITPAAASTDSSGLVRAQARLGSALGRHVVEIDFDQNPGKPGTITLEAANPPVISQLSPASTSADGIVVIDGQNFGGRPELNEVMIDGSRARVASASATRLEVRVPVCVPTRSAEVVIRRGSLVSAPVRLAVTAVAGQELSLTPGRALTIDDLTAVSCVRLGRQSVDAAYLVITQNPAEDGTTTIPARLTGLRHGSPVSSPRTLAADQSASFRASLPPDRAHEWEVMLRKLEAEIIPRVRPRIQSTQPSALRIQVPEVGERREFRAFKPREPATIVTAVARAVGRHVAIFEDLEAAGSVPQADLDMLVRSLDDPVYITDVAVFGEPSDLDRNQRVIVLLTPMVNRLTGLGETSFISGYFYYCDLVGVNECADTNESEILYSVVPDPTGRFGLKHPTERILQLLPPLIAHELQHLIHFNQRILRAAQQNPETLWLQEGLAHFAEDTVATVLRSRGLLAEADRFGRENLVRATFFLRAPHKTSLISSSGEGSLEERGAAWLFLKYLIHRQGGGQVLRALQTSPEVGARNVSRTTGLSWTALLRDWAIALYASGAPDLAGITLPREQTLGAFDLRAALRQVSSQPFPLPTTQQASGDFALDWAFPPSAGSFAQVTAAAGSGINLILAGERGGDFKPEARPQIVLLRIR